MLSLLLASAIAGVPCIPLTTENYLEGEHFWVQWETSVADAEHAADVLAWAEASYQTYADLGWQPSDETVIIRIQPSPSAGGLTTTSECDSGGVTPVITLFVTTMNQSDVNVVMHEVVHTFEYSYSGTYLDGITSWSWWLEGTAVWLTNHADNDPFVWRYYAYAYLEIPWTGVHQTALVYSQPDLLPFIYGTTLLAQYIEDQHGMEAVISTWEYSRDHRGDPIYLPDAITAAGIDFEPFWQDYMARLVTLDITYADELLTPIFVEDHISQLPSTGAPRTSRQPQGMGMSVVHFRADVGEVGKPLQVTFEGDPDVPWIGVLVRTKGVGVNAKLEEWVPLVMEPDGNGAASLDNFDGSHHAYLMVSPQDLSLEPHDYVWSAELFTAPVEEEKAGCGCQSTGTASAGWLSLLALVAFRRRGTHRTRVR
ncbi:MAG: hypothetical protein GWP91_03970 [Rhodobacterales bacterium]|nr:hypothetical protein [Rhodobacterales bacterium]